MSSAAAAASYLYASLSSTTPSLSVTTLLRRTPTAFPCYSRRHPHYPPFSVRAINDSNSKELFGDATSERSEADKIVDGMNFGELCNEFECISSPAVEATARQLARDILELREGNRALGTFAVSVKYKDPLRSFAGREKYKRPLWATDALDNPSAVVQEMMMLSTSILSIKWTLKGKPKSLVAIIGGDVIVKINSQFTLNQISGQVIEHEESWDLSASSPIAQAYFWSSRRLFSTVEGGKDAADFVKKFTSRFSTEKENLEIFPDPSGDPSKIIIPGALMSGAFGECTTYQMHPFFQRDDSFQRDVYQVGLALALLYFVVQFLRTTL